MRNRYYSPVLRRFLNCDIIEGNIADSTTLNLYTYVNGNPISFVDPFGLSKERGQPITIYHGIINNSEDTKYADKTIKELREMKNISALDFLFQDETYRLFTMGLLANELSSGKMRNVVNEMILYFAVGVGGEYSNDILTDIVKNNDVTQKYMEDITLCFLSYYNKYNGDVSSFANSDDFKQYLKDNGILLSKYSYGGGLFDAETYSGLTFAIHQWTESKVDLTELYVNGNYYSGTLQFTFKDTFGLDSDDINTFGLMEGFRSWYILQHYDMYEQRYKPFTTVVTINYNFNGQLR